jgi:hypothetical protein
MELSLHMPLGPGIAGYWKRQSPAFRTMIRSLAGAFVGFWMMLVSDLVNSRALQLLGALVMLFSLVVGLWRALHSSFTPGG